MLFDLRGRHRRRAVRVIYTGLALLMGVGLVGFGIGGGFGGGGLLNAASENEGANSASFANQIKKYEKITAKQPTNVTAWEKLTAAQLHEAGGEAYVTRAGLTSKGKTLYSQAAQSWNRYLALNPPKPSLELAKLMVRIFDEEGLNQPSEAVKVLQVVVAAEPANGSFYAALAQYAYKAHNTRIGDLASAKAVALAPAAQRKQLKTALAAIKKNPTGTSEGAASTSAGSQTITTTSTPTSTSALGAGAAKTTTTGSGSTGTSSKKK
jgi:tetratricopeptide (TPR) repeat protein